MKRILRLGNSYALSKHKRKQYTIRYISLLAVLTSMCLYAVKQVSAQQAEPAATAFNIKPLQIGDTIPEWLWHHPLNVVNHPDGQITITLDEYRGKLIILDFWAPWCAPCIKSLTHLDSLSATFKEGVMVLPVTNQNPKLAEDAIRDRKWSLPSVVSAPLLEEFFPHNQLPHQIWIMGDEVRVISYQYVSTLENIQAALDGSEISFYEKDDDLAFNPSAPLLIGGNGGGSENLLYQSVVTKMVKGATTTSGHAGRTFYSLNTSALGLLAKAFLNISMITPSNRKRIMLNLPDSLAERIELPKHIQGEQMLYWFDKNLFSYSLTTPTPISRQAARDIMKQDLRKFFETHLGITCRAVTVPLRHYVITPVHPQQSTKGQSPGSAANNNALAATLNTWFKDNDGIILIDASCSRIPQTALTPTDDLKDLAAQLKRMEYDIKMEYRDTEILIIDHS